MPLFKQIMLSLIVIVLAAGGWYFVEHRDQLWGATAGGSTGTSVGQAQAAGGQGGGPGRPRVGGFGPPLVVTAAVEMDTSGAVVRAIGTLKAAQEITIYPQVTGLVQSIDFKQGEKVEKGDVLVRLDDADQKVAVDTAEIALSTAKDALDRATRLSATKNITAVDLDNARAAEQKAEIDLRAAQLELAKRTITAPFSGVTGLTDIGVGDLMSTSKAVTTLDDLSTLTVDFVVPQRVVGLIATGQKVDAITESLPGQTFVGEIVAIDSRIDAEARTLKVRASIPNESGVLKPGMAITITEQFKTDPRPSVPSLALQWDRQGSFVWKLDGSVVRRVPAQVISRRSGIITVAADLKAGDLVVTEGVLRLREGLTVARADEPAAPALLPAADTLSPGAAGGTAGQAPSSG